MSYQDWCQGQTFCLDIITCSMETVTSTFRLDLHFITSCTKQAVWEWTSGGLKLFRLTNIISYSARDALFEECNPIYIGIVKIQAKKIN